jgi:hypothetical protein
MEEREMSIAKMIFASLCVCLIALTPTVRSQNDPQNQAANKAQAVPTQLPQIPGFFDPKTGMFSTQAKALTPAVAVATTSTIARLIFNFQILTDNAGASTFCSVSLNVNDAAGSYSEYGGAQSPNGGQTCQVTVLFSWDLATPATDLINVQYSVNWSGGGSQRYTSHAITSIPVPANTETISLPTIHITI